MWEIVKYFVNLSKEYLLTSRKVLVHPQNFGEECYLKSYDEKFLSESIGYFFQSILACSVVFIFLLEAIFPADRIPTKMEFVSVFLLYGVFAVIPQSLGIWWLNISRDVKHIAAIWFTILGFLMIFDVLLKLARLIIESIPNDGGAGPPLPYHAGEAATVLIFPLTIVVWIYKYVVAKSAFQTEYSRLFCAELAGAALLTILFAILPIPVVILVSWLR